MPGYTKIYKKPLDDPQARRTLYGGYRRKHPADQYRDELKRQGVQFAETEDDTYITFTLHREVK